MTIPHSNNLLCRNYNISNLFNKFQQNFKLNKCLHNFNNPLMIIIRPIGMILINLTIKMKVNNKDIKIFNSEI